MLMVLDAAETDVVECGDPGESVSMVVECGDPGESVSMVSSVDLSRWCRRVGINGDNNLCRWYDDDDGAE
eukprot:scaffold47022_cov80-Cyclotella_meneghiniana.AAC.1